jgi:hypothetical protein
LTKQQWFEFQEQEFEIMKQITKAKNADYTGINDDPFANFTSVELTGICTTEQGFLVRMQDKMARISSYAQKGELEVRDESVQDTLRDLANYATLLNGYIESKRRAKRNTNSGC